MAALVDDVALQTVEVARAHRFGPVALLPRQMDGMTLVPRVARCAFETSSDVGQASPRAEREYDVNVIGCVASRHDPAVDLCGLGGQQARKPPIGAHRQYGLAIERAPHDMNQHEHSAVATHVFSIDTDRSPVASPAQDDASFGIGRTDSSRAKPDFPVGPTGISISWQARDGTSHPTCHGLQPVVDGT